MIAFLLCLTALLPTDTTLCESVDNIQCEHVYDDHAKHAFSQFIFRDSYGEIIAWRMVKGREMWPRRIEGG